MTELEENQDIGTYCGKLELASLDKIAIVI